MNKKILIIFISILSIIMIASVGTSFASKPVEITSVMFLNAEIINANPVGMNIVSERELVGSFTSGPFEGDIYREIRVVIHSQTGKVTVQNMIYVENGIVTVDELEASGSFVIKVMGMVGNAKWTIISSDLAADGQQVILNGQGTATVTGFIPVDATHYNIENTLMGQINLTP